MNWFTYALISVFLYGGIDFLYKTAAHLQCSSRRILFISGLTVASLSLIFILILKSPFINFKEILLYALLNSSFFALGSLAKIRSLKLIPSSYAFPVTKLNAVFLVIYALILFNDRPSGFQWAGIIISLSIPLWLGFHFKSEQKAGRENPASISGLWLAVAAALSTSISMLTGKLASTAVPLLNYMFVSYVLVVIYTLIINKFTHNFALKEKPESLRKSVLIGMLVGVLNFAGYYFVLKAFASGPLSLIQGVTSNSFVISVLFSVIVFREKFSFRNAIVMFLAIASIVLIKAF